jgi:hypothetical protein
LHEIFKVLAANTFAQLILLQFRNSRSAIFVDVFFIPGYLSWADESNAGGAAVR